MDPVLPDGQRHEESARTDKWEEARDLLRFNDLIKLAGSTLNCRDTLRHFPVFRDLREDGVRNPLTLVVVAVFHRVGEPIKNFRGAWRSACLVPEERVAFRREPVRGISALRRAGGIEDVLERRPT